MPLLGFKKEYAGMIWLVICALCSAEVRSLGGYTFRPVGGVLRPVCLDCAAPETRHKSPKAVAYGHSESTLPLSAPEPEKSRSGSFSSPTP